MSSRKKIYDYKFRQAWQSIKNRCYNKNVNCFKHYGGRGIEVSKDWLIFENFVNDMWESYKQHLSIHGTTNTTIDRIDTNGNYCKENCKWSSIKEQNKNRRPFNKYRKGITIASLARQHNIKYGTVLTRLHSGWNLEKALNTPLQR